MSSASDRLVANAVGRTSHCASEARRHNPALHSDPENSQGPHSFAVAAT